MEIDAGGGAVTGGLIAGAIEKREGRVGEDHGGACTDCGSETAGKFCSNCGQPTHVHRSLLHLIEEVLHGVLHFDGRIWRTLPLLALNPGRLTREWIHGKRARYISPLALFLFSVFVMFFVMSFAVKGPEVAPIQERLAEARQDLAEDRAGLAKAEAELRATPGNATAQGLAEDERRGVAASERRLAALQRAQAGETRADGFEPGSWQAEWRDMIDNGRVRVSGADDKTREKLMHKIRDPEFALYKLQQTVYKWAWLLVPLSIPFMWLLFAWRRRISLYDHGVFVLYSLAFVFIYTIVATLIGALWGAAGSILAALFLPLMAVHMFAQLKGGYELSWFSAAWRFLALTIFCWVVVALFIIAIFWLGFLV